MAASAALRGVRSGPASFQIGTVSGAPVGSIGNQAGLSFDAGIQQPQFHQGPGSYSALFGLSHINGMNGYGGMSASCSNQTSVTGINQDLGNTGGNRSILDMTFPYQSYSGYSATLGNPQTMLMAQAAYLGLAGKPGPSNETLVVQKTNLLG